MQSRQLKPYCQYLNDPNHGLFKCNAPIGVVERLTVLNDFFYKTAFWPGLSSEGRAGDAVL